MERLEQNTSILFPGADAAIRRAAALVPLGIASGALGAEIRRVLDREGPDVVLQGDRGGRRHARQQTGGGPVPTSGRAAVRGSRRSPPPRGVCRRRRLVMGSAVGKGCGPSYGCGRPDLRSSGARGRPGDFVYRRIGCRDDGTALRDVASLRSSPGSSRFSSSSKCWTTTRLVGDAGGDDSDPPPGLIIRNR